MKKLLFTVLGLLLALPAVAQDYRIKPGDVLRIEVLEDQGLNRDALVLPDGSIAVPMIGTVPAGGRTINEVRNQIGEALAPNFASKPTVFVAVNQLSAPRGGGGGGTITIYVMGEAAKPGSYQIPRGSTFLQALASTGGLGKFAARKRLQLRRGDKVYVVNYNAIEQGAATAPIVLTNGDIIMVPQRRLFE